MYETGGMMSSQTLCESEPSGLDEGGCCLICCGPLRNPTKLICEHIFCADCLQMYYYAYKTLPHEEDVIELPCPTCTEITQLPAEGFVALSASTNLGSFQEELKKMSMVGDSTLKCDVCNFTEFANDCDYYCNKCQLHLCKTCRNVHNTQTIFKDHAVIHISTKEVLAVYCEKHNNSQAWFYCVDCKLPVCTICIFQIHSGHHVTKLRDALASHRDTLRTVLNSLQQRIHQTQSYVDKIEGFVKKHLNRIRAQVDFENDSNIQETSPLLSKQDTLESPVNVTERRPSTQNSILEFQGPSRKKSILPKFLSSLRSPALKRKNYALNHNQKHHRNSRDDKLNDFEMTRLTGNGSASAGNHSKETIENGRKTSEDSGYRKSSTDSNNSTSSPTEGISPDGIIQTLEKEMGIDVTAMNFHVEITKSLFDLAMKATEMSQSRYLLVLYDDIVARIDVVLNTDIPFVQNELCKVIKREHTSVWTLNQPFFNAGTNASTDTGIFDRHESPSQSVHDSLSDLTIDDQMCMLIKPELLWKVEKNKADPGELWNPVSIDFLPDRNVVVAEYDSHSVKNSRLRLFDLEGNPIDAIAQDKVNPLGLSITKEGNIAVTDCAEKRIKIFNTEGQQVAEWGKGQFGWPYGITTNSKGQFIISDTFNDTISIHSPEGRKLHHFGGSGKHRNQFKNPYHLTIDSQDNIIVSDCGNHCVKIFDPNGKFIRMNSRNKHLSEGPWSTFSGKAAGMRSGSSKTSLKSPRGLCVDPKGNILVADDRGRVCILDSNAKFERNLLTGEDGVNFAEDLAVNAKGQLAVTEWNPNNMFAIKVFGIYE